MSDDLKSCPFCGSEQVYPGQYDQPNPLFTYIYCEACESHSGQYSTEQRAREAWNARAEPETEQDFAAEMTEDSDNFLHTLKPSSYGPCLFCGSHPVWTMIEYHEDRKLFEAQIECLRDVCGARIRQTGPTRVAAIRSAMRAWNSEWDGE